MYLPSKAKEALKNLGLQIKFARKRRLLTISDLAEKIQVSSPTVIALEKGLPTIGLGVLASALWILGLEKELLQISNPDDIEGQKLMTSRLPQKIKIQKRKLNNDF